MQFILILFASLLGSLHCAGMCGGFAAMCSQNGKSFYSQMGYHIGRLVSYVTLGLISGVIGSSVNKLGEKYGISSLAGYIVGGLLIFAGIASLFSLRIDFFKFLPLKLIMPLQKKINLLKNYSYIYPILIGIFSAFLPCAWLYSYLAIAADSTSILNAGLVMFFFWLGTLPILISIGGISKLISSPIKRFAPLLISIMMILAGTYSLYTHINSMSSGHCSMHHQN